MQCDAIMISSALTGAPSYSPGIWAHCFMVFGTQVVNDVQQLVEKDGQWLQLEQELTRTTTATSIGLQLYEVPLAMMKCENWTKGVKETLDKEDRFQIARFDLLAI